MKKLLQFVDNNILKFWVAFLLVFIPVYPKLPAIDIPHTWVYIRLEDFFIATAVLLFGIQFIRRKVTIFKPFAIPIFAYWAVGFVSLALSLLIIGPGLPGFFPTVSILSYLRRIEYLILFFIGFAAVNNKRDMWLFIWAIVLANSVVLLYGLGQRFYIELWEWFPSFFEKFSFCFPSIQTTNEEFAKGTPLCLPKEGRITSLFGGHYDLSAYLVLIIPALLAVGLTFKKFYQKFLMLSFALGLLFLLIFTASRVSFAAYFLGAIAMLVFIKKKKLIIPLVVISLIASTMTESGVMERLLKTVRFANVVVNEQGEIVGTTGDELSEELKRKLRESSAIQEGEFEELPTGSSIITLPGSTATNTAILKNDLDKELKDKYAYGAVEISSVSGTFLVQRALVYDISFTTRFQAEWPNAWKAFARNPLTGSGYGTITMATDNSLLRALGEVGALGFGAFLSFFLVWYIFIRKNINKVPQPTKYFALGLSGGLIGLFANATLIDVFEASKVAENLWLILGVTAGSIVFAVGSAGTVREYWQEAKRILLSPVFLGIYVFLGAMAVVVGAMDNFFIGDDFALMRWAANADQASLLKNFVDAKGHFFRPVTNLMFFFLYTFNAFKPFGYYLVNSLTIAAVCVTVFGFLGIIFRNKWLSLMGALTFGVLAIHHQNIFWLSTNTINLSTLLILWGLIAFYFFRTKHVLFYIPSFIFFLIAAFTYEGAIIFGLLAFVFDIVIIQKGNLAQLKQLKFWYPYFGFLLITLVYLGLRLQANAAGFSGDYNYNLAKLLPNSVGNFVGYVLSFFLGTWALPLYTGLREGLRSSSLLISGILGVILIGLIGTIIATKAYEKIKIKEWSIELFGLLFIFVSLLPFLGLGNVSERYLFLGSVGFIILMIGLLNKFIKGKNAIAIIAVVLGVFALINFIQLRILENEWHEASRIVYRGLVDFKTDHADMDSNSTIAVIGIPNSYKNAYVFPAGFEDSLWFIYRNRQPDFKTFATVEEADADKAVISVQKPQGLYRVFQYNELYQLKQIR